MTIAQAELFAAKRDLWLVLARALAPPGGESFHVSFARDLASDLSAIAEEMGLNIAGPLGALRKSTGALADALETQRLYAVLFATPPTPVFMNTAIYLDGALLGESELDIHDWYRRHGFERHAGFHDLNDHAAVQLEFVGLLYGRASTKSEKGEDFEAQALAAEAQRFLAAYPRRWITPFLGALQLACRERGLNSVYLDLASIVWQAIEADVSTGAARYEYDRSAALPAESSRGIGEPTASDLAEIATRLRAAGLGIDHIRQRPEWREEAFAARAASAGSTGNAS